MGYDNHEVSELLYPSLTTIALALESMGYEAVSLLIKKCEGTPFGEDTDIRIKGTLIERKSIKELEG